MLKIISPNDNMTTNLLSIAIPDLIMQIQQELDQGGFAFSLNSQSTCMPDGFLCDALSVNQPYFKHELSTNNA